MKTGIFNNVLYVAYIKRIFVKGSYLSTSIFSLSVHENAFQILSCTVIGYGDTSNIVQNRIIKK